MGARLKKFGEWLKKQEEDRKNGIMKQREREYVTSCCIGFVRSARSPASSNA
jgi:hypothetical protein